MNLKKIKNYLFGIPKQEKILLSDIADVLGSKVAKTIERDVKYGLRSISKKDERIPTGVITYPVISGHKSDWNNKLSSDARKKAFDSISSGAFNYMASDIAPHIVGYDKIKEAVCLLLLSKEQLHILLLGDPGTGKTDILRAAEKLASKSAFGLGSGTSGAGLGVTYARGERHDGLLLQAHKGLCLIDELNLMKKDDRAYLYNAMEKGFITFDKGGRHETFPADIRVLATANPKGDRFKGSDVDELRSQLPFEAALLSRFHLVFLLRRPDKDGFARIAKSIVKNQKKRSLYTSFFKEYISYARELDVVFPDTLEQQVTDAARKIKEHEDEILIEVSPRLIKGIIGFSKASARSELRTTVTKKDVDRVISIYEDSLGIHLG